MWTLLSHVLHLVLLTPLDYILHLPAFDEGRAAYPVTRVYRDSVGLQQKEEKAAVVQGHSH